MPALSEIGFDRFFEEQLEGELPEGGVPARVAAQHRGAYEVWWEGGEGRAELARPRTLARELVARQRMPAW